jgi:hypothetical protein
MCNICRDIRQATYIQYFFCRGIFPSVIRKSADVCMYVSVGGIFWCGQPYGMATYGWMWQESGGALCDISLVQLNFSPVGWQARIINRRTWPNNGGFLFPEKLSYYDTPRYWQVVHGVILAVSLMFIRQSIIKLSSSEGENDSKNTTTMTPIIDCKTQSSWFKRHIMLFLSILLVGCCVGLSLGRNLTVYIWRRPLFKSRHFQKTSMS